MSMTPNPARMNTVSRKGIVVLAIASLLASAGARQFAASVRAKGSSGVGSTSTLSVSGIDSYALALLLGGLRGPLVMVLWPTSESQKTERNLADFDTKVEWIRLLQPEFDSVHIFQIWNKAYNISVQMASVANKYATILDAIDYGMSVDAERPNNINILSATAQLWFDKLGSSNEKQYYRSHVRAETLPHGSKSKLSKGDPGWRRVELDPMLDNQGNILPKLLKPTLDQPALPLVEYVDGSELQFLKQFEPFPQGISPLALGYNLYKRSQVLQSTGKQRHLQLSDLVVDSRPALALKTWAEEEWELGRRSEIIAFGIPAAPANAERMTLELPTSPLPLTTTIASTKALDDAIYNYDRTAQLCRAALVEYDRHIKNFQGSIGTYRAHLDHIRLILALTQADRDYLLALKATDPATRKRLADLAIAGYKLASDHAAQNVLAYYSEEEFLSKVLPASVNKFTLKIDPEKPGELTRMAMVIDQMTKGKPLYESQNSEDRQEYIDYIRRSMTRLNALGVTHWP